MPLTRIHVSTLTFAVCLPAAAAAQVFDLGEIVVSSTLTPVEAARVGVAASVIDSATLERAGSAQVVSVLDRVPGLAVARTGPLGSTAVVRIRGAEPRYVAVLVDGVRVDDPTGIASEFDFGALTGGDIGRIEILRGSQSALYGGSAVGGVVSMTTRRPERDGFSQDVAVEAGSHSTLAARYGLRYRDGRGELAFNLGRVRSKGFSAYDTLPRTPGLERDGFAATRMSFSGRFRLNDDLTIGASGFLESGFADYDGFLADADNRTDRREIGGRMFAEWRVGASEQTFEVTRYRITREDFAAGVPSGRFEGQRTGLAWRGVSPLGETLTLVYGADRMRERALTSAQPAGRTTITTGAFVQGIWTPTPGLDLTGNLRYDHSQGFGNFVSARLAGAWAVTPEVTLRGALARGFRAPSIYEQFGDPRFGIAPNPGLSAETSRSAEIGADWRPGGGAQVSATLFLLETGNAVTYCGAFAAPCAVAPAPPFSAAYQNVPGTSRRKGAELAAQLPLGERVTASAAYTYVDARLPSGARIGRVPRHSLAMGLDATLTDTLTGRVGLRHVGGRPADGFPAQPMPAFTTVDVGLDWQLPAATVLGVGVRNLFDRQYQEVQGYATAGRTFHVSLRKSF
ncbi:MAG: TonB-dependent receptor plug domain-containing protein [Gemmobacter sp.]